MAGPPGDDLDVEALLPVEALLEREVVPGELGLRRPLQDEADAAGGHGGVRLARAGPQPGAEGGGGAEHRRQDQDGASHVRRMTSLRMLLPSSRR